MIRSTPFCLNRKLLFSIFYVFILTAFSFAQNAIVTENANSGNPISEWGVPDFRDNRIAGFATKMSLNRGQTVRFKINVQSGANYTIKIYRIGYYGGNGGRLIQNLGTFTGTVQPNGTTNTTTGMLDCSNWSESASWAIPSGAVSGLYIAKLERSGGGSNHIVFIVRNDASNSDLYLQFPDATWQAYNGYGGTSNYDGTTSWPSGHAVKVSYNRPFFPYNSLFNTDGREADWYMNAEYPMIRWLERNGYDVTYTSCNDVANNGSRLLNHKVFISLGHDEYWSKGMRDNVESARNAGVNLAFLSGNEVYWKTRWENNDGTEDRTLVCYKEGTMADGTINERACGSKCDGSTSEWTGLWRMGGNYDAGKPENTLTGQISWVEYPSEIGVPAFYKKLRFWRNSSVANLSAGQTADLGINTLGYEWDYEQPAYASSTAPGRITMSSKTVNSLTHKLSLFRHSSGALVFGAGTVQWSWGLDGNHWGGSTTVSPEMQQATVNLFADMGAQPGTLQSGLTSAAKSTDATLPTSSITSPSNGSSVGVGASVTFSGTAADAGGGVVAAVEVSTNGGSTWSQATISAIDGNITWSYTWTAGTNGTYTIRSRGVDDSGNIGAATGITIIVGTGGGDITPPTVSSVSPASGSTGVNINTTVTANFSESVNSSTVTGTTFQLKDAGNNVIAASVSTSSNQITLTPTAALTISTTYTVTIVGGSSGVKDLAGNALVNNYSWSFTTGTVTTPPPVTIQSFSTKTGAAATVHSLTGVPAGALLVLSTTADTAPTNCNVSSSPSLTWTKRVDASATSSDNAEIWTAVYTAGGAITVTSNWGAESQASVCYVVLNAETSLGGASATGVSQSSPSVAITTTRDNSIIVGCTADWKAMNGATRTLRDAATERLYFKDGNYTTYYYTKAAATTGAYTEGVSLPTGQQASTTLLEIRGGASAPDITPPTVSSVTPVNGATGVPVSTTASAIFNEAMDATTINGSTIELRNASNALITATVSYNAGTKTVTVTPSAALANSIMYTVTIKGSASGVKDLAGNALVNNYSWSFTTEVGDVIPPTVSSVTPVNAATDVSIGTTVSAIFNEAMNATTINSSTIELRNGSNVLITASVSYNAGTRTVTLTPSAALANSTVYTAKIISGTSGVKDAAGNALASDYSWSFTTEAADITPPTVSSVTPVNGATDVSVSTTASAIFSEAMDATTINSSTIELRNASNSLITAVVSYNAGTKTATITPSAALNNSTVYTAKIISGTSGVRDVAGNALASVYSWSFTTGAVITQPPVTIQSFTTKTGTAATVHSLTGVSAGALLVLATTADAVPSNCSVSSSPSLTWTKRSDAGATSSDNAEIWTAVYSAGGSINVTSNWGGGNSQASVCYVVLNAESSLGGASATGVSQSAPSVAITTTRNNSIIFGCTADWKAINGTTRTLRDAATERLYFKDGNYTTYYYTKAAASIAAYTEGVSLPTGQQASTALLEIRGAGIATKPVNPAFTSITTTTNSTVYNNSLGQNYPNPFHKVTHITFTISKAEKANLTLFDINGRVVKVLVNAWKDAGAHTVNFNAEPLANGIYYYRIQAGEFTDVKKLIIW